MATEGGRIDFMFLAPPLTRPLDLPLETVPTPQGAARAKNTFMPRGGGVVRYCL